MDPQKEAEDTLIHYMKVAGVELTNDMDSELRQLVDHIIDAAVDEVFRKPVMQQLLSLYHGQE